MTVDTTGMQSTLPTGLTVGDLVKVKGTLPSVTSTTLTATRVVKATTVLDAAEGQRVDLEGLASGLGTSLKVGGVTVNALPTDAE